MTTIESGAGVASSGKSEFWYPDNLVMEDSRSIEEQVLSDPDIERNVGLQAKARLELTAQLLFAVETFQELFDQQVDGGQKRMSDQEMGSLALAFSHFITASYHAISDPNPESPQSNTFVKIYQRALKERNSFIEALHPDIDDISETPHTASFLRRASGIVATHESLLVNMRDDFFRNALCDRLHNLNNLVFATRGPFDWIDRHAQSRDKAGAANDETQQQYFQAKIDKNYTHLRSGVPKIIDESTLLFVALEEGYITEPLNAEVIYLTVANRLQAELRTLDPYARVTVQELSPEDAEKMRGFEVLGSIKFLQVITDNILTNAEKSTLARRDMFYFAHEQQDKVPLDAGLRKRVQRSRKLMRKIAEKYIGQEEAPQSENVARNWDSPWDGNMDLHLGYSFETEGNSTYCTVQIADSGIGMDARTKDFSADAEVDKSEGSNYGGTGSFSDGRPKGTGTAMRAIAKQLATVFPSAEIKLSSIYREIVDVDSWEKYEIKEPGVICSIRFKVSQKSAA